MATTRRVLVTGSRTWTDHFLIHNVLTSFHWMLAGDNDITLVSGNHSAGADRMCEETVRDLGWNVELHPADWDQYKSRAGLIRNDEMVALGADVCLAFILDDSRGATYTANAAEKAGIETLRFRRWLNEHGLSGTKPPEKGVPKPGDPDILRAVENIERRDRLPEK